MKVKKILWLLGMGGIVFVILAGLLIGWSEIGWFLEDRRIEKECERVRTIGEPLTPDDFSATYRLPTSETHNTELWEHEILPELVKLDPRPTGGYFLAEECEAKSYQPRPPIGEAWPCLGKYQNYLGQAAEALEFLHQAAELGGVVQLHDDVFSSFADVNLYAIQNGIELLFLEADVLSYIGDHTKAAIPLIHAYEIAEVFRFEPTVGGFRQLWHDMVIWKLQSLLPRVEEKTLEKIQLHFKPTEYREELYRDLFVERIRTIEYFRKDNLDLLDRLWLSWYGAPKNRHSVRLETMSRALEIRKQPWPELFRSLDQIQKDLSLQDDVWLEDDKELQFYPFMEKFTSSHPRVLFWIRSHRRFLKSSLETSILSSCTKIGIGAERFFRKNGRYPDDLTQLVPDFLEQVPEDPFGMGPLIYLPEENGFAVYSVGENGVDDGGKKPNDLNPDIVFRVVRK